MCREYTTVVIFVPLKKKPDGLNFLSTLARVKDEFKEKKLLSTFFDNIINLYCV